MKDLENRIKELEETLDGYKKLTEVQQKEIFQLKRYVSENEKNKNLLQGYRKVIEDISSRARK